MTFAIPAFVEIPRFERGLSEPKSLVLPLHHTSIHPDKDMIIFSVYQTYCCEASRKMSLIVVNCVKSIYRSAIFPSFPIWMTSGRTVKSNEFSNFSVVFCDCFDISTRKMRISACSSNNFSVALRYSMQFLHPRL